MNISHLLIALALGFIAGLHASTWGMFKDAPHEGFSWGRYFRSAVVGAVMAPRFGYLTPNFAFNPLISFQVVIMSLLGGMQRLWGPVLGVVPLMLLSELLQVRFPFWYSVFLGLVFMIIVYFLPRGITGLVEDAWRVLRRPISLPRGITGPLIDVWGSLSRPISLPRGIAGYIEDTWARLVRRQPTGGR